MARKKSVEEGRTGIAEAEEPVPPVDGGDGGTDGTPPSSPAAALPEDSENPPERLYRLAGKATVAGTGYRVRRGEIVSQSAYDSLPAWQQAYFTAVEVEGESG